MSRNTQPEVELTRGLGLGIGVFIALFAAAIVVFALHLWREPPPSTGREAQPASLRPAAAEAPVEAQGRALLRP